MSSLGSLLLEDRDPTTVIAQRRSASGAGSEFVRWAEFRTDVARLANRITEHPSGAWTLATEDAYAFAVGLFSLWHTGRHALSPPNHQPESMRALQTRSSGVLTDHPEWFPDGSSLDPLSKLGFNDPGLLEPLERQTLALELYTSGTTGDGKAVIKRIAHLEDEVEELQNTWDDRLGNATVFSTASHQHLYCLVIGLLWPLCSGRPFERRHYLHAAELVPPMKETENSVLVSVPTHLKRFVRHAHANELEGTCRAVFSSGGPLPVQTAHAVSNLLGSPPIEILGSTETGIVGWRHQEEGNEDNLWTSMPSVRIEREPHSDAMRVDSPFVSVDSGDRGFSTGDRVEIRGKNRFVLLPRLDRVVKIGEKRLDLARMESDLRGHGAVEEIALVAIDREGEPRVAAALVPSDQGRRFIANDDSPALAREIRTHLANAWDPVLHPRLWRFVEELPENAQGKVTREMLLALFETPGKQEDRLPNESPTILEELRGRNFVERACAVPVDLACLPGHFPGHPVVPAVLQLGWAVEVAGELLGTRPRLVGAPTLKFLEPLQPGQTFRIRVQQVDPTSLDVRLWKESSVVAQGRLKIAPSEATT